MQRTRFLLQLGKSCHLRGMSVLVLRILFYGIHKFEQEAQQHNNKGNQVEKAQVASLTKTVQHAPFWVWIIFSILDFSFFNLHILSETKPMVNNHLLYLMYSLRSYILSDSHKIPIVGIWVEKMLPFLKGGRTWRLGCIIKTIVFHPFVFNHYGTDFQF